MGGSREFPITDHEFVRGGSTDPEYKYCAECHEQECFHAPLPPLRENPVSKAAAEFRKWKFAGSLPQILVMYSAPSIPMGAFQPDFDTLKVQTDDRFVMGQVLYTTPKRIHGLLHYDAPNKLFFIGYECGKCEQVFLVPDSVDSEDKLQGSLQHGCSGGPTQ